VDWRGLAPGERGRRVPLPTYPFERQRYWTERTAAQPAPAPVLPRLPAAVDAPIPEALADLWRELLGVGTVGPHDDFFELGGHSLLAVQLGTRIREVFGIDFPQQRLLEHRTLARLGAFIQERTRGVPVPAASEGSPLMVELNRGNPRRRPLFLLHPVGGTVFTYQALARLLDPELPIYAIRARGLEPGELPAGNIEAMARLYLEAVRTRQPSGPYRLAGHSFGGVVAYEMAQQLLARGELVETLMLLDSPGPGQMPVRLESDADIEGYFQRMAPELFQQLFLRQGGEGSSAAELPRSEVFLRVFRENAAAMFAYAPRPYAGRLVFFHARERDAINPQHPELAWIPLASEGVEVHVVPGDHSSMLRAPHVQSLAGKLRGLLGALDGELRGAAGTAQAAVRSISA
jgi:thioesterase domain-containing protein/acyl carrier protein